jgi:membrane fusion protein (multidrug efflux system)
MDMDVKARLVALAAIAALGAACADPPAAAPPPPPEVYVMPVVQQDVPTYLELVGQTRGYQDVDVRARVEGFLERVHFQEGSLVRAGAPLYDIDR